MISALLSDECISKSVTFGLKAAKLSLLSSKSIPPNISTLINQ